ncbi:MAG: UDP-glucose 4-epimerase GalE [Candidatus Omnitrophota bacterium]
MKKTILVVGGAGYIGSHAFVELLNSGYDAAVIDNFSNAEHKVIGRLKELTDTDVRLYEGDCNDRAFMDQVFRKEAGVCGVIHFAAFKAVGESVRDPLKYYQNNIGSTLVLLDTMIRHQVELFVFSSSCTVYGQPDQLPVTELTPKKQAQSPYGNTKRICEEIIEDCVTSGAPIKAVMLRYFNPIGAHPSALIGELPLGVPNNLVPFVTQTVAGIREKLTVFGNDYKTPDGTCVRDYIHVVDLAKAHVKALDFLLTVKEKNHFDLINVGTGKGNSVMEVIKTFERVTGKKVNHEIGPRRDGDVEAVYANADKAKAVIGWEAGLTLEDALKDAWNWQKSLKQS